MAENTPAQGQSKGKSIACMACGIASIVLSWSYGSALRKAFRTRSLRLVRSQVSAV